MDKSLRYSIHIAESYKIKNEIHSLYEEWRNLPNTSEEAKKLSKQMFERYKGITKPKNIEEIK